MSAEQPIIVIKKKGGHGGHHGGAWKVAYADFVTAMMSLFIVLWLMNSTPKPVQEAIAGYFNDPKGNGHQEGVRRQADSEGDQRDEGGQGGQGEEGPGQPEAGSDEGH